MSRTINDAPLTTREARRRLDIGLHWRSLDADIHVGYRKGKRGGVWLVRWRNGQGYRQSSIGTADDAIDVRRQNIRHNSRRRLAECGPRLGVDVRRRACGVASADARWFVA